MERKILCNIITPERVLFEGEMNLAAVQIHDGQIGFLGDHTPLVAILGTGEIRLRDRQNTEYFFVDGGLVEIRDNKLVVLAEKAKKKEELRKDEIEKTILEEDIKSKIKLSDIQRLLSGFNSENFLLWRKEIIMKY